MQVFEIWKLGEVPKQVATVEASPELAEEIIELYRAHDMDEADYELR